MRRHELEAHRRRMGEIRDIMRSMKTLAAIEMHKLDRHVAAQADMSNLIVDIAADFLQFHPDALPRAEPTSRVVLALGSERGFCGDFNARVAAALRELEERGPERTRRILVGGKLQSLFDSEDDDTVYLQGADVAEEIVAVLDAVAATLAAYRDSASFYVVHHGGDDDGGVQATRLLPPFLDAPQGRGPFSIPPALNISPRAFVIELVDQYLFTRLVQIFYLSLTIENEYRMQHLDHAIRHLDDSNEELGRKINMLRQEEIIEEIEVILLNAAVE